MTTEVPMASAWPMIEAGMLHQVAAAEQPDMGRAPNDPPYHGSDENIPVSDHGIDGHAGEAQAYEDRRDDGGVVHDPIAYA